jgi:hypothetical protein
MKIKLSEHHWAEFRRALSEAIGLQPGDYERWDSEKIRCRADLSQSRRILDQMGFTVDQVDDVIGSLDGQHCDCNVLMLEILNPHPTADPRD